MWPRHALDSRSTRFSRRLGVEALEDRSVPATVSIGDASLYEGDSGTQMASLAVWLSGPVNPPVTVTYATAPGTATAGVDYRAVTGTVTFLKGQTYKTISIPVIGDLAAEPDESFTVNLKTAKHATVADGKGSVTILDDDTRLSINDVTAKEGQSGTTAFTFDVTLSPSKNVPVSVNWYTSDGDYYSSPAFAGSDYTGASGTLTFAPGETSKQVTVQVAGDQQFESDETFYVYLNSPSNAIIGDGQGIGTIQNDDAQLNIGSALVTEGNAGTTEIRIPVTLIGPAEGTVTVDYSLADDPSAYNTATADEDYTPVSGTLTFNLGETIKEIVVQVKGDSKLEFDEHFMANLSNASGAEVGQASAWGTITNDDGPIVSVDDVWQYEGSSGTTTVFAFTVRLSMPAAGEVQVDFATANGWAIAGEDYEATSGTLTFAPGETEKTIYVTVYGDDYYEGDENFSVALTLRSGTALVKPGGGTGWIGDDDYYDGGWGWYDPGYGYY